MWTNCVRTDTSREGKNAQYTQGIQVVAVASLVVSLAVEVLPLVAPRPGVKVVLQQNALHPYRTLGNVLRYSSIYSIAGIDHFQWNLL